MRDPGVDARVDAALEETRHVLGLLSRLGGLAPGREVDPDHEIKFEARIWLTLEAPMGRPPPEHVRLYLSGLVADTYTDEDGAVRSVSERPAPPKRKGRRANTVRDQFIVDMIARIAAEYRINPTRDRKHRDKRPSSGCSIVAKMLDELHIKIDETSVETVWTKLGDQAQPKHLPKPIGLTDEQRARIDRRLAQLERLRKK